LHSRKERFREVHEVSLCLDLNVYCGMIDS